MTDITSDAEEVEKPIEAEVTDETSDNADDSDDTSLEDMEFSAEELEEDDPEEEESEEQSDKSDEDSDDDDEEDDESKDNPDEPEAQDDSKEKADQEEQKELSPEEQKQRNDEFARKRIAEREDRDKAKAQAQDKYLEDAEDDKDLALRQLQVDAYNNKVERNRDKLQNGIDRAVANIDIFTKGSPEAKEALIAEVENFERASVQYDQNGDPISVNGDLYEHLTKRADSIRRLIDVGARQNAKDKKSVKTKTIPTPSKTPKEPKSDPDVDGFDEEVNSMWE